jgi:hypothetical protein
MTGVESFEAVGLIVFEEEVNNRGCPLGQQPVSDIQQKQRKLAEVAEMINTGILE